MTEVHEWLEGIGLAQYAAAFEANHIDTEPASVTRRSCSEGHRHTKYEASTAHS